MTTTNSATDAVATAGTEFSGDDYDEAYPDGYEAHYWHQARGEIVRHHIEAFCRPGETLLEIGAGRGHYVRVLRAAGFDAYGCDLGNPKVHDDVAAFCFAASDFATLDVALRQRVSAVLLLDVIEHIERPSDFLASVFEALPALRTILITVPARQELWSNYDEHYRHFLRYDVGHLRQVAQASGLSIRTWSYFFHALYLPAFLLTRIGRPRATAFPAPTATRLHRLLGALFSLESRIMPKALPGTSLIAVCTRPPRAP